MSLSDARRKDIVEYRLEKSKITLEEVKEVAKLGYWSLAANRLYYAAYYACVGLLISKGIEATTHKGTMKNDKLSISKRGSFANGGCQAPKPIVFNATIRRL